MHTTIEVIAEAGVNHNGSLDRAIELVDAAADAGAHTVKFQTFRTEELVAMSAPMADYQKRNTGVEQSQFEMLKALELKESEFQEVQAHCNTRGIDFISTPFDIPSLHFLANELDVKRLKLGSGELTNGPLLYESASTQLPIIISTGMANLAEVKDALAVLYAGYKGINLFESSTLPELTQERLQFLNSRVTILHCTSNYPASVSSLNLRAIETMASEFGLPVGYSDHSLGIHIPGSCCHGCTSHRETLYLDKDLPGPDHKAS